MLVPWARSNCIFSNSGGEKCRRAGLPTRLPARRACAIPAFTRSRSISRSNSAPAPRTVNVSLPRGRGAFSALVMIGPLLVQSERAVRRARNIDPVQRESILDESSILREPTLATSYQDALNLSNGGRFRLAADSFKR